MTSAAGNWGDSGSGTVCEECGHVRHPKGRCDLRSEGCLCGAAKRTIHHANTSYNRRCQPSVRANAVGKRSISANWPDVTCPACLKRRPDKAVTG